MTAQEAYGGYDTLYDFYLYDALPRAIQYGQTAEEFWHGEPAMFEAYERAYYNNVSFTGFVYGRYIFEAFQTGLFNALRKKGQQAKDYMKKPIELVEDTREIYRKARKARKIQNERKGMASIFARIENRYEGREQAERSGKWLTHTR